MVENIVNCERVRRFPIVCCTRQKTKRRYAPMFLVVFCDFRIRQSSIRLNLRLGIRFYRYFTEGTKAITSIVFCCLCGLNGNRLIAVLDRQPRHEPIIGLVGFYN